MGETAFRFTDPPPTANPVSGLPGDNSTTMTDTGYQPITQTPKSDPGAILPYSLATGALAQIGTSIAQAGAIQAQSTFKAGQLRAQSEISGLQAAGELAAGESQAEQARRATASLVGKQVASAGSQGVATPVAVTAGTQALGEADISTIKQNAWRKAWGYQVQGGQENLEAKMTESNYPEKQTLLTGGAQAAAATTRDLSSFLRWSGKNGGYG